MRSAPHFKRLLLVAALLPLAPFAWQVTVAQNAPGESSQLGPESGIATTETLGGADRYLTHLSMDKPIYRPGETVYIRGVLLHQADGRPQPEGVADWAWLEIRGPKGDRVAGGQTLVQSSTLGLQWEVPREQAGGQYTVEVTYPNSGQPPAQRTFEVRAYRAPRLKTQIKFVRDGYGPGDEVLARLQVERAEGGIPAGAPVSVQARVDGDLVYQGQVQVDASGQCLARFPLPTAIRRGEGTLTMVVEDGGVVESASKTIPILLQTVDLRMYPEGGDLVAGLPCRVYFEAFTPYGKPADLAGQILDQDGQPVARLRSEHEGRGRFAFTPRAGGSYVLSIESPAGIATRYPLPEVRAQGAVLRAEQDVFAADQPLELTIAASQPQPVRLTVRRREQILTQQTVQLPAADGIGLERVRISLPDDAPAGVLIVTLWDEAGQPLAERLVFRQPARQVRVELTADHKQYVPGGKVTLNVRTTDAEGRPLPAVVGLTVTDDSVLELIDKREQTPRLPVMVLLENDVRELADAHVYLDPDNEQAPLAVDLLLGVQGWRRFALVRLQDFLAEHGDSARRALALRLQTVHDLSLESSVLKAGAFEFDDARGGGPLDEAPMAGLGGMPGRGGPPVNAAAVPQSEPNAAVPARNPVGNAVPGADAPAPAEARDVRQDQAAAAKPDERDRAVEAAEEQGSQAFGGRGPLESAARRQLRASLEEAAKREAGLGLGLADAAGAPAPNDFVAVRVYAHQVRPGRQAGDRVDFTETLFWHAGLPTDENGRATIEFGLNDSVTSFRVLADAFDSQGALGAASLPIESVKPFYLEPKLPLEVTMNDVIQAPLGIVNATDVPLDSSLTVHAEAAGPLQSASPSFALPANSRLRKLVRVRVGKYQGQAEFTCDATAGPYADRVVRSLQVRPLGFPRHIARGGLLAPGETATVEIEIPDDVVPGSLQTRVVVYPTPLANLTEALERLIREPSGCFEQTSSTTYPLVMAQQYFLSHEGVDPSLVERSGQTLDRGYQRLIGFESPSGGFEWFGGDPGHDALTAYGLLQFTDMSQVHPVDSTMLERTRAWLLAQRDGQGGYQRKTHTLHTWIADPECANTYNTWSLLSAGVTADLSTEVAWVEQASATMRNTYAVALAANVLGLAAERPELAANRTGQATREARARLLDKLAGLQAEDGSLEGATTSVVGSGGQALAIETTALATLAWLEDPGYAANIQRAVKYLCQACEGGRFGSTQSTVLALRAIVAYDASRAAPRAPGSLQLQIDGTPVGQPLPFTDQAHGPLVMPSMAEYLGPGRHTIQLAMTDGASMPFSIACEFHGLKPESSTECPLHLGVELRDQRLAEGQVTEAELVVVNRTGNVLPTPLAIVGIPGGLEVRHDQLKELVKAGRIAAYEVRGREVILYWRSLAAEQRVDLPLSLVAAIPGTYTGPASRAYLYYTDEHKTWVDGLNVTIDPK